MGAGHSLGTVTESEVSKGEGLYHRGVFGLGEIGGLGETHDSDPL